MWVGGSYSPSHTHTHTHAADWTKFSARLRTYTSLWCCVNHHPGHVHYDMQFDVPHVDKFNKKWDRWEPTTGP